MEIKVQLENGNENEIQFINENKRPFENWKEKSIKITKIDKLWTKKKRFVRLRDELTVKKASLESVVRELLDPVSKILVD